MIYNYFLSIIVASDAAIVLVKRAFYQKNIPINTH